MPNAWDVGSALVLQSLGFPALATTSSGLAAALGRHDQTVTLDELVDHVRSLCAVLEVPVSVDSESGFAAQSGELGRTVARLAEAGASGVSIEDYVPGRGLLGVDEAAERVAVFAAAAEQEGLTVSARAENHLYDVEDLADTIGRLGAYRQAGAHVLYAPGLDDVGDIARLVAAVEAPVNVLLLPGGPAVPELAEAGVRRVSTGGLLAFVAYGAMARAARELLETGMVTAPALSRAEREAAFGD